MAKLQNGKNSEREKRDFWDISALVPPRGRGAGNASGEVKTKMPEATKQTPSVPLVTPLSRASEGDASSSSDVPLSLRYVSPNAQREQAKKAEPERVYEPNGGLVREVRIYPWQTEYAYYEQFCTHAKKLLPLEGKPCEEVSFFSYMPQYSQLSRPQLAYYLWWRTNFRRGTLLDASYSYLLLYLYEIINLDTAISPKTGQENMLRLWLGYREKHPRLDVLLREWLCDYSLVHQLPPPALPATEFLALVSGARLREFFLPESAGDAVLDAVLYFCSNYNYKKSKFYTAENAPLFDTVMRDVARVTLQWHEQKRGKAEVGFSTVTRDAFSGALCSYRLKKRIEVDFSSFSHTHELRFVLSDALKYAENAIRAANGIKSRLTVYEGSAEFRAQLDAYLSAAVPKRRTARQVKEAISVPQYEARYDLPSSVLSVSHAGEIEAKSWQTTKRLVEAFEGGNEPTEAFGKSVAEMPLTAGPLADKTEEKMDETAPVLGDFAARIGKYAAFLALAAAADRAAQRAFALQMGLMLDAIADIINTAAGDTLGDVVLEDAGGYYTVIEDYRDFLIEQGVL